MYYKYRKLSALKISMMIGLLASSGAASAQSNVTLYGLLDASIMYTSRTLNTTTGQTGGHQVSFTDSGLSGTNFGLRGAEDLGGGMRAIFTLESGVSLGDGAFHHSNGNFFGRQAWVGIDSNYGTVKTGVQFSPFFLTLYDLDPRGMSNFGTSSITYVDNVLVTGIHNGNSFSYTSPEFAGLQAAGFIALGGTPGDFQAGRQYSASLRYHSGGLTVSGALYSGNSGGTLASTPVPSTVAFVGRAIGASYRFPQSISVFASYALFKVAGSFDNSVYSLGVSFLASPALRLDAGVWYTRDGNDGANHSILGSAGAQYFLSKSTSLYSQVGVVHNHGLMNNGLSITNALYGPSGTTIGLQFGIRHLF